MEAKSIECFFLFFKGLESLNLVARARYFQDYSDSSVQRSAIDKLIKKLPPIFLHYGYRSEIIVQ